MTIQHQQRDRHRDPGLTVRPPKALKEAAQIELASRDRTMRAYFVACLNALVADPDRFLAGLDEHWPADTPRGRPRKTTPQPAEEASSTTQEEAK